MIPALLQAAVAVQCAAPDYCPTGRELFEALRAQQLAFEVALNQSPPTDGSIVYNAVPSITGISDAECRAPHEDTKEIRCRVTVHYTDRKKRRTVLLARKGERWAVVEQ